MRIEKEFTPFKLVFETKEEVNGLKSILELAYQKDLKDWLRPGNIHNGVLGEQILYILSLLDRGN